MLQITRYRFYFQAMDPIHLPPFPGSAVRGIFGHGLKRSVCVTGLKNCVECDLRRSCVYSYLFETQLTVAKGRFAPQPLVLDVHHLKQNYDPGDVFFIEATLVGKAGRNFPYLIQAWQRAGRRGLGRGDARFDLDRIEFLNFASEEWRQLYPGDGAAIEIPKPSALPLPECQTIPSSIRVHLLTPYRSKRQGHLVTPESFDIQGLIVSLVTRVAALRELHDPETQAFDAPSLIHAAKDLQMTQAELRWKEWTRHSSRQSTHMQIGGVTGTFTLSGAGMQRLWPVLQLGQWLHAGKNTLFGLGCYQIASD